VAAGCRGSRGGPWRTFGRTTGRGLRGWRGGSSGDETGLCQRIFTSRDWSGGRHNQSDTDQGKCEGLVVDDRSVAENHEYDPVSEAKCGWEPRWDGCDSRKNQLGWHAIGSETMEQPRMAEHLTSRWSPSGESAARCSTVVPANSGGCLFEAFHSELAAPPQTRTFPRSC
jgi:hypothetical protein